MKKLIIFSLFICVLLSLSGNTSKVQAEDFVVVNGVLKEYNGTSVYVTIPSSVEEIDESVFEANQTIQSVVISSSVKRIGPFSFYQCPNLQSVTILGAESIGVDAFADCTNLSSLSLPSTLKKIYGGAFMYCSGLTKVDLPAGLELIGAYAFSNTSVSRVEIPANVSEIYGRVFPLTTKMTVTKGSFGEQWANENTYTIESVIDKGVVAPNMISLSHQNLIMSTSGYVTIYATLMPVDVTNKAVIWTSSDPDVVEIDSPYAGDLMSFSVGTATITATAAADENIKATCTVTVINCPSDNNELVLPSDLTEINETAFEGLNLITKAVLPDGLTKIGSRAFADCPCLNRVNIPDSVSIIEDTAFLFDSAVTLSCQSENAGSKYARKNHVNYVIESEQ